MKTIENESQETKNTPKEPKPAKTDKGKEVDSKVSPEIVKTDIGKKVKNNPIEVTNITGDKAYLDSIQKAMGGTNITVYFTFPLRDGYSKPYLILPFADTPGGAVKTVLPGELSLNRDWSKIDPFKNEKQRKFISFFTNRPVEDTAVLLSFLIRRCNTQNPKELKWLEIGNILKDFAEENKITPEIIIQYPEMTFDKWSKQGGSAFGETIPSVKPLNPKMFSNCPNLTLLRKIDNDCTGKGIDGDSNKLKRLKEYLNRNVKKNEGKQGARPDTVNTLRLIAESLYTEDGKIKTRLRPMSMFSK